MKIIIVFIFLIITSQQDSYHLSGTFKVIPNSKFYKPSFLITIDDTTFIKTQDDGRVIHGKIKRFTRKGGISTIKLREYMSIPKQGMMRNSFLVINEEDKDTLHYYENYDGQDPHVATGTFGIIIPINRTSR